MTLGTLIFIEGISYIQNYFDPARLDFSLKGTATSNQQFTVLWIMSDTASWASIHFHYLVTSRNDIRAGSFTFDSPELLTPPTSNESRSIQLNHFFGAVRRWSARSNYVIVYTYLAGVTSEDRFLDLRIGSSSVNLPQSTISLTLTISNQDSPIENIYVSFVMYTDMNSPVDITIINSMINAV